MSIKTEFTDIDNRIKGFKGGDLICIAARPGMGKTTFAYNLATNIANNQIPVLIFSLENSKNQVQKRIEEIISLENKVENTKIKAVIDNNTYILDNVLDIASIKEKARQMKSQKDIGLVIIDYLQLIKTGGTVNEAVVRLKLLAKELNIPIIILSQLSNKIESREDKRPKLLDFENSYRMVTYADIIMFIYRDDYYNADSEKKCVADIITSKNKYGRIGTDELLVVQNKRYVSIIKYY